MCLICKTNWLANFFIALPLSDGQSQCIPYQALDLQTKSTKQLNNCALWAFEFFGSVNLLYQTMHKQEIGLTIKFNIFFTLHLISVYRLNTNVDSLFDKHFHSMEMFTECVFVRPHNFRNRRLACNWSFWSRVYRNEYIGKSQ